MLSTRKNKSSFSTSSILSGVFIAFYTIGRISGLLLLSSGRHEHLKPNQVKNSPRHDTTTKKNHIRTSRPNYLQLRCKRRNIIANVCINLDCKLVSDQLNHEHTVKTLLSGLPIKRTPSIKRTLGNLVRSKNLFYVILVSASIIIFYCLTDQITSLI